MSNSSIQKSRVAGAAGINGASGIYMTQMNALAIQSSNFFENEVSAAPAATSWAASIKFNDRADPLPLIDPLFAPANAVQSVLGPGYNYPLQNPAIPIPVYVYGPNEVRDNVVIGAAANVTGGIAVPAALITPNYFLFGPAGNVFLVSGNNPGPVNATPNQVVVGH